MVWRGAAAVVSLALALAGAQSARGQAPGAEQQALSRQLVDVTMPASGAEAEAEGTAQSMRVAFMMAQAFAAGGPKIDEKQFSASVQTAARADLAPAHAAMAQAYARAMSAEDLRAALLFYRSREGQAALQARSRLRAKAVVVARQLLAGQTPKEDAATLQFRPSAAELAFADSPSGKAMVAALASISAVDAAQRPIEAASADYCTHAKCDEDLKAFFKFWDSSVAMAGAQGDPSAMSRAHGEHAMFGSTASDLFPDAKAAKLARAACVGDAASVAAAVKDGADPNAVGKEGTGPGAVREVVTPLLWAIDCGSLAGMKALLDAGANPNQAEQWGATPVTVAAATKDPAVLALLLSRGGDPNAHDERDTALEIAMGMESGLELVDNLPKARAWANWDALLAAGADPDRVAPKGRPLMEAAAMSTISRRSSG